MADDLGAWRPPGLAGYYGAQLRSLQTIRQQFDLGGLAGALTTLEGDEAPAQRIQSGRHTHRYRLKLDAYSLPVPARNRLIMSSLAPSNARRMVEPVPIASAA